jgi:hypothetical protein
MKSSIKIESPIATAPTPTQNESRYPMLPHVFMPFPRYLALQDIAYLQSRRAFALPSEALQIEILAAYFDFVQSSMPVLDTEQFISSIKYGFEASSGKRISLLLFQAVMFAGIGYVSIKTLREEGFATREAAKQTFFKRVPVRLPYPSHNIL